MRPEKAPSDIAAVAHTALSLENYAQIYACILQMKNKQIQLADATSNPLMTRKNLSEVLKLRGLSSGIHTKPAILERLELLNIFNPHRSSTDPDDLESDLPMEEMERDLAALGWIDCPLQSANVFEAYSEHYVPLPLMINEEAPNCSSQHLMSVYSETPSIISLQTTVADNPSTMSMQTTVADNPGKALIRKKKEKKNRKLQEVYDGVCTGMDFINSRTQGTEEIQDN